MTSYLVDFENIRDLSVITNVAKGDEVCILYTNDANISIRALERLTRQGVILNFVEVSKTEKNALDFQLDVYLGYLIGQNHSDNYVIVSNDNGFTSAVAMGKRLNAKVSVLTCAQKSESKTMKDEPVVVKKAGESYTNADLTKANKGQVTEYLRNRFRLYTRNENALKYAKRLCNKEKKDAIIADIQKTYAPDLKRMEDMLKVVREFYQ